MNDDNQTVFIVDDDEDVRDSLVELLESIDLQTRTYANAQGFLDEFNTSQQVVYWQMCACPV